MHIQVQQDILHKHGKDGCVYMNHVMEPDQAALALQAQSGKMVAVTMGSGLIVRCQVQSGYLARSAQLLT